MGSRGVESVITQKEFDIRLEEINEAIESATYNLCKSRTPCTTAAIGNLLTAVKLLRDLAIDTRPEIEPPWTYDAIAQSGD